MKDWSPRKKTLLMYLVSFVVGAILSLIIFWVNDLFKQTVPQTIYRLLSNGFFFAGVLLAGSGALVWLSNEGTFNFLSYAVQKLLSRFIHTMKAGTMSYSEFVVFQNDRKKAPFGFLIFVGFAYILVAGVFALLSYT